MLRTVEEDSKRERWKYPKKMKDIGEQDKLKIMKEIIEFVTRLTFGEHYYRWNQKLLKQAKGGPIGLRATGSCAKLVMDIWMEKFAEILHQNNIKVFLLTKYVDDVLIVAENVQLGHYWNGKQIV